MKLSIDMAHVKAVSVAVLLEDGKIIGKVIANWSNGSNGSVCTASIFGVPRNVSGDGFKYGGMTGKAGGGGYDKLSGAIYDALIRGGYLGQLSKFSHGDGCQRELFRDVFGLEYVEVV